MLNIFQKIQKNNHGIKAKNNNPSLVMTTTNELFIPVRLYYKIHNIRLLRKALNALKCVEFYNDSGNDFFISYFKEAKNIGLSVSYNSVPEEVYPVILAQGQILPNSVLHIDLKSCARGIGLINFITKYISPHIIELTALAHLNKVFASKDHEVIQRCMDLDYDELFNDDSIHHTDVNLPFERTEEKKQIIDTNNNKGFNLSAITGGFKKLDAAHEAEKIHIKYNRATHKTLLSNLQIRLKIKEIVALNYYKGNKGYKTSDAIKEVLRSLIADE